MLNAFGGGGGVTALAQTGAQFASGGSGGGLFDSISSVFSLSKWSDYGSSLWNGFSSAASTFWNGSATNGFNMFAGQDASASYWSNMAGGYNNPGAPWASDIGTYQSGTGALSNGGYGSALG